MASTSAADANCSWRGGWGSAESHGASRAFFDPLGRPRHSWVPEDVSVNTYPAFESPWMFHALAPQWVHLASLTSTAASLSLWPESALSQCFFERHVPSGSTSVSSWGRRGIWYEPGEPTTKNRVSMEQRRKSSPARHSESLESWRKNGGGPWALATPLVEEEEEEEPLPAASPPVAPPLSLAATTDDVGLAARRARNRGKRGSLMIWTAVSGPTVYELRAALFWVF